MKQKECWLPAYWKSSPMYLDQQCRIERLLWQTWPDCNELNRLWLEKNKTLSQFRTRFVAQSSLDKDALYYEQHIFNSGEIPTREENWHDFFNAMVWLQFGKIKSALNALHVSEIERQQDNKNRSRKRDALTLFDESGVIFISSNAQVIESLQSHDWKDIFWQRRDQWWRSISVFIIGHGLYEKILTPYIGMTANALPILVEEDFFDLDRQVQVSQLDRRISAEILKKNLLESSADLTPLPILGVPNWWPENSNESFYENVQYFRPKRMVSKK